MPEGQKCDFEEESDVTLLIFDKSETVGFVVNQFKKEFTDNIEISLGMGSPNHILL